MIAPAAARTSGIDPAAWNGYRVVATLLAARVRMMVNGALRSGRERRAWALIAAIVAVGVMVAVHRVATAAFGAADVAASGTESTLATVAAMVVGFTLVTSITFALSAFYFSSDLTLLLTSPVPARAVLLSKLTVQLATGTLVAGVLAGPVLIAYLPEHGGLVWFPWVVLVTVLMAALPLSLGTMITVIAVRVIPARRVRDAGGLLVTATVFVVTAGNLLIRGPQGFTAAPGGLGVSRGGGVSDSLWLPSGWAARSVAAAFRGDAVPALGFGLPLVVAGLLALVSTALLLETAFVAGVARSSEAAARRSSRRRLLRGRSAGHGVRPTWMVIARKDLRETLRDASQLGQLALPLSLFALYIAAPGSATALDSTSRLPTWYATSLTAAFAALFAASGVALRGVGSEGRRLWILRVSPTQTRSILAAKFCSGMVIAGGLGSLLLSVGVVRGHMDARALITGDLRLLVVIGGMVAMATGIGALRPRLDWTDPRRAVGVWLSLAFLAAGSTDLGVAYVILAVPYARPPVSVLGIAVCDAALVVLAVSVAAVALRAGAARLRAVEL